MNEYGTRITSMTQCPVGVVLLVAMHPSTDLKSAKDRIDCVRSLSRDQGRKSQSRTLKAGS